MKVNMLGRVAFIVIMTLLGASCFVRQRLVGQQQPELIGPVSVVRFPEPWVKWVDGSWRGVNDNIQLVVRRSSKSGAEDELLFAAKQGFDGSLFGKVVSGFPEESPGYDYFSDNRFAVSLKDGVRVREVSPEEWNTSETLRHGYLFILSHQNPDVTENGVNYKNQLYKKTGKAWGTEAALVSPDQNHIAVFSYSSNEKPSKPFIPGLGGTEPGRGEAFLDIYDTSSGERIAAAKSPFGGQDRFSPSMLFGASVWIEDRYLIMPLHWELDGCLIAVIPQSK